MKAKYSLSPSGGLQHHHQPIGDSALLVFGSVVQITVIRWHFSVQTEIKIPQNSLIY